LALWVIFSQIFDGADKEGTNIWLSPFYALVAAGGVPARSPAAATQRGSLAKRRLAQLRAERPPSAERPTVGGVRITRSGNVSHARMLVGCGTPLMPVEGHSPGSGKYAVPKSLSHRVVFAPKFLSKCLGSSE
jgi:hypothetical protein